MIYMGMTAEKSGSGYPLYLLWLKIATRIATKGCRYYSSCNSVFHNKFEVNWIYLKFQKSYFSGRNNLAKTQRFHMMVSFRRKEKSH